MNFYKDLFGRWVSGFGLLMAMSGSVLAQGPFDFNGDSSDWSVTNSAITAGDYAIDYNLSTGNINNNRFNYEGGVDGTSADPILAITLKNTTDNTKLVFGLSNGAVGASGYRYITGVSTDQKNFSTIYYDMSGHPKWNANVPLLFLRFKVAHGNNNTDSGSVYIDKIELLDAQPTSSPSMIITSSTSGVTDGSSSGNSSINLVFTASEVTTDFDASDISVTNGAISNFTGIEDSDTGMTYTATFTPSSAGGTTIDVAAGAFTGATSSASNLAATQFNWEKNRGRYFCTNACDSHSG
jgi:hypothetical protein